MDGKVVVPVRLNGARDVLMMLDTGATVSMLATGIANDLHLALAPLSREQRERARGAEALATLKSIAIAGAPVQNVETVVGHLPPVVDWNHAHPDAPIAGVLGLNALVQCAIGLDFEHDTLEVLPGGHITPQYAGMLNEFVLVDHTPGTFIILPPGHSQAHKGQTYVSPPMDPALPVALPLGFADDIPLYYVDASLDDVTVRLYVDTGAPVICVTPKIGAKLRPVVQSHAASRFPFAGEQFASRPMFLHSLRLGALRWDYPQVAEIERGSDDPSDALLGLAAPVFAHCRVILDFPGRRMYVARYMRSNDIATALSLAGLFLQQDGAGKLTLLVAPGSNAASARLRDGDALISIGGKSLADMDGLSEADLTRLFAGPTLRLTVRRSGETDPVTVELPITTPAGTRP